MDRQLVLYNPNVSEKLNSSQIWTTSSSNPGWAKDAWSLVSGVIKQAGGNSAWKQYIDEFVNKQWATDYGAKQAALAVKRFYDTASSKSMNPEWSGSTEVASLNKAAYHETGSVARNIANRFFAKLHDFDSGNVLQVGGAPDLTPNDGKGLIVKAGQTAISMLTGDELEARGKLIELGKTELGPLLHQAFKKLPHDDWMKAIEKEWDVEDANFRDGEQVVTKSGKLAIIKKSYIFRKDVVTIELAETGKTVDVQASLLNRSFKRAEWVWTARFEPMAGKVVKSIGLIIRVQKVNVFYQVRKLSDGTEDLFLAKHMMPMALKYQAVLNSTPMVIDFKAAAIMNSKVKRSPCGLQKKMENNLAMHEGREQYDNMLTRQLVAEGDANNLEVARAIDSAKRADAFGLLIEGNELPWQSTNAQQLIGVARTGQSWLEWLKGPTDFPLAVKENRRRIMEQAGLRRRLAGKEGAEEEGGVKREAGGTPVGGSPSLSAMGSPDIFSRDETPGRTEAIPPARRPVSSTHTDTRLSPTRRIVTPDTGATLTHSGGGAIGGSGADPGRVGKPISPILFPNLGDSTKAKIQQLPQSRNDCVREGDPGNVGPLQPTPTSYMPIFIFAIFIVLLVYFL